MNVLVIGNGGREHAIAWRASQGINVNMVYVAPGNAGTALDPKLSNVDIEVWDIDGQIRFAKENDIELTIIGPEAPLVAGIVDNFRLAGLRCFGPSAAAARLEGSKIFTKEFLSKYEIPTAAYGNFDRADDAVSYARNMKTPIVIKADGLAAGKGVIIASTHEKAEEAIRGMMTNGDFGEAGTKVVVEEFLLGEEASFIVVSDGEDFLPFASSQDHKAVFDGDKGPNTGGMGAYSPAPVITDKVHQRVLDRIIRPTIDGMREEGTAYTGFLYAGLMIDAEGNPYVIEYNCRLGDPETQPLMMRMRSDLVQLCNATLDGRLADMKVDFVHDAALTVVLAAGGYPGKYNKDDIILGLDLKNDGEVFHGGTKLLGDSIVTNGGRILGVTALGKSVREAKQNAYKIVDQIDFQNKYYRSDIGHLAIAREKS
ncbi:MAG: phosphoribosylamine--glycine ligase [Candidatus Azotimanducaceae bacterium]|uniref:Phosphoribosylamine--glycine ligase n=1 Tax=OM182 bacterium TaxID=2510334 RepID=A0A520S3N6_9GAMM|nr:phosphoribosylamine--glycine ligase [Gammaproteobacteria bacterium]OUV67598.1 MAG: phosphoribosylamine--glycine ligase [Gammaproteobacteria bacterium TMED133]RZO77064.1 MAG: phosphoribosylamine--glycine ligase [OM182 bacterium]